MTTIKRNLNKFIFVAILFLFYSCSIKQQNKPIQDEECKRFNIETETEHEELENSIIYQQMKDFNFNNDKSIDVVRIIKESSYNTNIYFKRFYIQNDKAFIFDNEVLKELSSEKLEEVYQIFESIGESKAFIYCDKDSSRRVSYDFYVKKNNKLFVTISSNTEFNSIISLLNKDELNYITFFENLRSR